MSERVRKAHDVSHRLRRRGDPGTARESAGVRGNQIPCVEVVTGAAPAQVAVLV